MEVFLPDHVKVVLLALVALAFVLSRVARAFPGVAWLQVFHLAPRHLTEEEQARRRRHANRLAAFEIMLAGLVLPLLYVVLRVMMFHDIKTSHLLLVGLGSVSCFVAGAWVLVRNR